MHTVSLVNTKKLVGYLTGSAASVFVLLLSACQNMSIPSQSPDIDGNEPLTTISTNQHNTSQRFGFVRTAGTTVVLNHFYLITAPNPENKFVSGQWLIATEKPVALEIENPENIGIFLSKLEKGIRLQLFPDALPQMTINIGQGWAPLATLNKPYSQIMMESGAATQKIPTPFDLKETYSIGGQHTLVKLDIPSGTAKALSLPTPARPAIGKRTSPISTSNGEVWPAYVKYCDRNRNAGSSLAAYENFLKETGRYPSKTDLSTLTKHFGKKITAQSLVESMFKQDQQRFLRMPTRCNFISGVTDGRIAELKVDVELEGKRTALDAYLKKYGSQWRVIDHSRWIPLDN